MVTLTILHSVAGIGIYAWSVSEVMGPYIDYPKTIMPDVFKLVTREHLIVFS